MSQEQKNDIFISKTELLNKINSSTSAEDIIELIKEEPEVEVVPILPVAEWLAEDERMGASTFEVRVYYWKAWLRILGRRGGTK